MDIEEIKERIKNKDSNDKKQSFLKKLLTKVMALVVIFLITIIFVKKNDTAKEWINKNLFTNNISFTNIKSTYNKYFGSVLPFEKIVKTEGVFNENLVYSKINKYKDGVVLTVEDAYLVPIIKSGIVVFVGEKEDYGKTIVVECADINIWYGNIDNTSASLYDYVELKKYLGEVQNNKLYLVFEKDGEFLDYKDFI